MNTKVRTHIYLPDGIADYEGKQRCAMCGLAERHPSHVTPANPAAEVEARRLGERLRETSA